MRAVRPAATLLLLVTAALLAGAAAAAGGPIDTAGAVAAIAGHPAELALLLSRPRLTRSRDAKRRAEACFLDFVELFWSVIEPGQPFVRGRVQDAIALHLEAVTAGRITKLLCNVPPGSTKSLLVDVFWPAWEWGPKNRPDLRYMSWSYSPDLTRDHNDMCRQIIKSELYQQLWGDRFTLDDRSDAKEYFRNSASGWRRASSVRGAATGFRADRLIFDDPHNVKDADSTASLEEATTWFAKSLPTRVRNASGREVDVRVPYWVRMAHNSLADDPDDPRPVTVSATVGIMQRVHLFDVSGLVLENPLLGYEILLIEMRYKGDAHPARKSPGWRPSTIGYRDWRTDIGQLADPIRFPEDEVVKLETAMRLKGGDDAVAAQFDQWPLQLGGTWFTEDSLGQIVEPHEVPIGVDKRGWDWAGSENENAAQTADARLRRGSDGCWYLMDSDAVHAGPTGVDARVRERHVSDPRHVDWSIPRDPGAAGIHFAAYIIRQLTEGRYVHDSPETGSKVTRMKPVSGQAGVKNFKIVRHSGCEVTRSELISFPYGRLDRADAISRAFAAHVNDAAPADAHGGFRGGSDSEVADSEVVVAVGEVGETRYSFDG